jgi:hypothetical protein
MNQLTGLQNYVQGTQFLFLTKAVHLDLRGRSGPENLLQHQAMSMVEVL